MWQSDWALDSGSSGRHCHGDKSSRMELSRRCRATFRSPSLVTEEVSGECNVLSGHLTFIPAPLILPAATSSVQTGNLPGANTREHKPWVNQHRHTPRSSQLLRPRPYCPSTRG
ncbi:unnamed protein product [Ixodes persulcatus]